MNVKRYLLASLAVFAAFQAMDFLIHGVLLKAAYEATKHVWRPDMDSKMWIAWVIGPIYALLFSYIFTKGYEGKGIMEGVRFGTIIGLFVSIPMAYGSYMMLPIPYSLAREWFIYGLVESIIAGVVVAAIYRPAARAA